MMSWGPEAVLTLLGLALYTAASVVALLAMLSHASRAERAVLVLLAFAVAPIALVLVLHGLQAGHVRALTRFEAFSSYVLVITAVYLVFCMRQRRTGGLSAILVPYLTVVLILGLPALRSEAVLAPGVQSIWLKLHIASAFVGYACFSLAGVLAVAYLLQDRNLKLKRIGPLSERLPPLETLDRLMSVQVGVAFLMLTLSIMLGVLLIRLSGGGEEWVTDPKVVATVATWCVFAILVHMRTWAQHRGRRVALVIIMGLLCLLFAFYGVHVVAKSVHDYVMVGPGATPP